MVCILANEIGLINLAPVGHTILAATGKDLAGVWILLVLAGTMFPPTCRFFTRMIFGEAVTVADEQVDGRVEHSLQLV